MMNLAGSYRLCPTQTPVIQGGRPILSPTLLAQLLAKQPLANVPNAIGNIFTLCGGAQALVSELAIATVQSGKITDFTAQQQQQLHVETLRNHLQQLAITWGKAHQTKQSNTIDWQTGLALLAEQKTENVSAWFADNILGMDGEAFWQAWQHHGVDALLQWAEHGETTIAQQAHEQRLLHDLAHGATPLLPTPDTLQKLWQAWQTDTAFCQLPHLDGEVYESGAWSRINGSHTLGESAWTRQLSSVVDCVALLRHGKSHGQYLQYGSQALGKHGAVAWAEMTRGVLIHFVQLTDDAMRVQDYGVLAPTEWNFHPQGKLAQTITNSELSHQQLNQLASAFDPCVAVEIAVTEEG